MIFGEFSRIIKKVFFHLLNCDIVNIEQMVKNIKEVDENMKNKVGRSLHILMCMQGGFLGGYAILSRKDHFANAQTNNMLAIVLSVLGDDWSDAIYRLLGFFVYCLALVLCVCIAKKTKLCMKKYAMLVGGVGAILLAFLPANVDPFLAIIPIFFMTATQWYVFNGTDQYACSTIFITNNLKQCLMCFVEYGFEKKIEQREKGMFYLLSIVGYLWGCGISFFGCELLGIQASLLSLPILVVGALSQISLSNVKSKFIHRVMENS